jgi:uncharacterized membrane protein
MIGIGGLALGWLVYDGLCKLPLARNEVALAAVGFDLIHPVFLTDDTP